MSICKYRQAVLYTPTLAANRTDYHNAEDCPDSNLFSVVRLGTHGMVAICPPLVLHKDWRRPEHSHKHTYKNHVMVSPEQLNHACGFRDRTGSEQYDPACATLPSRSHGSCTMSVMMALTMLYVQGVTTSR